MGKRSAPCSRHRPRPRAWPRSRRRAGSAAPPSPEVAEGPAADAKEGVLDGVPWTLVGSRDADPDAENPLTYRERSYAVPAGPPPLQAEALARARTAAYVTALASKPPGKFINVAIFDHVWSERPHRPPLVTAQMKDWVGELHVERTEPPPAPAAPEQLSPASLPDPRPKRTTNEQDQRLVGAFEACQDLFFLEAPRDALEFASRLFADLLPTERFAASLYDIDTDQLHLTVARGPDAEARRGRAFPLQGLLGEAARAGGAALRIEDAGRDARYVPEVDGSPPPGPGLLLSLAYKGRLLGVLTLYDRAGGGQFTQNDTDLGLYVAEQLAAFLDEKRVMLTR